MYYLLICRSMTNAQQTARVLERVGITAVVMRAPQEISIEGCGYCVKVSAKNYINSLTVLKDAGLAPKRVVVQRPDGNYAEVGV